MKILGRNGINMQNSTLPNFEISISENLIGFRENEKLAPHNLEKMQNRHLKT